MTQHDDLMKDLWQSAKKSIPKVSTDISNIIASAEKKKRSTVQFHILNILVLTAVLAGVAAFFYFVAPMQTLISHMGITLMLGGLLVRILIEVYSFYLSSTLDLSEAALKSTTKILRFYQFRKRLHSPVTLTIVTLYTLGFYMLTPEFSRHFSLPMMILIDASYIVGAVFLIWQIRKGIKKELQNLRDITEIQAQLVKEL
jgi:hypothetical protein